MGTFDPLPAEDRDDWPVHYQMGPPESFSLEGGRRKGTWPCL
jgi:hypothetical protein